MNKSITFIFALTFSGSILASPLSKQAFINKVYCAAKNNNAMILKNRAILLENYKLYKAGESLGTPRWEWMAGIANYYNVKHPKFNDDQTWQILIKRIDEVPTALLVAQAALKSGWGKSRLAEQANNFFGQHCYEENCGTLPKRRPKGAKYEEPVYPDVDASVKGYLHDLNTLPIYQGLRDLRAQLHQQQKPLTAVNMAPGLQLKTSEKKSVKPLLEIIKKYKLQHIQVNCDALDTDKHLPL